MDEDLLRRVMARAHQGDVDAQVLLRELVQGEQEQMVELPMLFKIVDGVIEPPDPPEDETGVREPRSPRPQAPSTFAVPPND